MFDRIVGVFRLDPNVFESIEHDVTATGQAAMVVLIAAIFNGLGNVFTLLFNRGEFFRSFFTGIIWALIGWVIWAFISYYVGTRYFGGQADLQEMLRVTGFAYAPLMLGIIPCIGGIVGVLWALAAMFIAVRQGLDIDDTKALITVLVGFVVYIIGLILIGIFLGIGGLFGRLLFGG